MQEEPGAPPAGDAEAIADDHEVAAVERELADVELALERLDAGTYATCEVCGGPIGDERLATDPAARTCAQHAS